MCGCGRTSTPPPGGRCAGPIWSKKMNGPTVVRSRCGSVRWTLNPPRSWVVGSSVWRIRSSAIVPPYRHSRESGNPASLLRGQEEAGPPLSRGRRLLSRRPRLYRERVNPVPEEIGERAVDRPLALDAAHAGEALGDHIDEEMAFPRAV